jgi:Ser-tRNA(Ala) deacylase AlaX
MKSTDPHMHTAEHILNQTMVRLLKCGRCFSAHIEKKKSKCDYRVTAPPTPEDMRSIEEQVNRIIQANLAVSTIMLPRADAARTFNLERLPADAGEAIRIVRVGDYDACPCRGEHVSHTGELGVFRITSWDVNGDVLRIRFKLNRAAGRPMESP